MKTCFHPIKKYTAEFKWTSLENFKLAGSLNVRSEHERHKIINTQHYGWEL